MIASSTFTTRSRIWDYFSYVIFGLLCCLIVLTFAQYGVGADGEEQDLYGNSIVRWYLTLGQDRSAMEYEDLYYYGGLFDSITAVICAISPLAHWATRHFMEALVGLSGLIGTWKLARHVGGSAAGFIALLLLAITPSYYGMMFINPKDVPFAAFMVWSLYAAVRMIEEWPKPSWNSILSFGFCAGLAMAVRVVGFVIFAYLFFIILYYCVYYRNERLWPLIGRMMARVILPSLAVAWAVMLVLWPWGLLSPLLHPLQALTHFLSLKEPNTDTLFFGQEVSIAYHPGQYLPIYMVIKLPDIFAALIALSILYCAYRVRYLMRNLISCRFAMIMVAALFPYAYVMIVRPQLYDADRHFIFVLPALATLVGVSFSRWINLPGKKVWVSACLVGLLAVGTIHQVTVMARLHPYEYAFYNDMVGGIKGAQGNFETEYWGTSLAEAQHQLTEYILQQGATPDKPMRVAICGDLSQVGDYATPLLKLVPLGSKADFFIAPTRNNCDQALAGRVITTVSRDGVDFAVVKDLHFPSQASANSSNVASP
jgi:hypothetical protein